MELMTIRSGSNANCVYIKKDGYGILIDAGVGPRTLASALRAAGSDISRVAAIFITHEHIDHSGLLPLMVREGFSKPIYCTKATSELLDIMLQDSAHIQEMEAQWEAKKYSRRGLKNPPAAHRRRPQDRRAPAPRGLP